MDIKKLEHGKNKNKKDGICQKIELMTQKQKKIVLKNKKFII